ncbi:GNAT family N-acetyltransferase [Micromonospora inyonensis]|uniref:Acetyltransferase (GNAT) domain-containing protein n=1 Tax=Micromonospora inyonensis TaxID=47866 RepID=A0A1C6RT06_9ACTN|nr:GNAT family N-acetyltransferase [Micromonospora inyonensis]SCL20205.1 Acetyltransferase (GNAT) domain-containing protein [Micromonospora inyonensis]
MHTDPVAAAPGRVPGFADKPTLTGERVLLRPFVDDDLPALYAALADPEVIRLTGSIGVSHDEEQLRQWYGTSNAQTDRLDLAVVDRATGACVGEVVLNQWTTHRGHSQR